MSDETKALTSQQVCDDTGASYRQLDYWTRQGYIRPTRVRRRHGDYETLTPTLVRSIRRDRAAGASRAQTKSRLGISDYAYYRALERGASRTAPPEDDPSLPGSGYARGWSPAEAAVIGRMVRLIGIGLMPERAIEVARQPAGVDIEVAPGICLSIDRPARPSALLSAEEYHEALQGAREELAGLRGAP